MAGGGGSGILQLAAADTGVGLGGGANGDGSERAGVPGNRRAGEMEAEASQDGRSSACWDGLTGWVTGGSCKTVQP